MNEIVTQLLGTAPSAAVAIVVLLVCLRAQEKEREKAEARDAASRDLVRDLANECHRHQGYATTAIEKNTETSQRLASVMGSVETTMTRSNETMERLDRRLEIANAARDRARGVEGG